MRAPTTAIRKIKAHLHGNLPSKPQERPFAKFLLELDFNEHNAIDVWFTQLLGTPDIDAVIVCRGVGLFVIELKGWWLSAIHGVTAVEGLDIDPAVNKSTTKTPWQQCFEAGEALQGKIKTSHSTKEARHAWVSCGAALFNISRSNFLRKFRGPNSNIDAVEAISEGAIFADDLSTGDQFIARLRHIKHNPLYKKAPNPKRDNSRVYGSQLVKELDDFINWKILPAAQPTKSDLDRLRRIEDEEERDLDKVDFGHSILCSGFAGTGKTVLALQAALRKQTSTLFTCYNKVLATDIRRLTGFSKEYREFPLDVYDVFSLIESCEARLELASLPKENNFDAWSCKRVQRIIQTDCMVGNRLAAVWKFIIVDESQDLKDYAWNLLNLLCGPSASLFVIDGKRQQLYRNDRAAFLQTLDGAIPTQNVRNKRRVFRTTNETFLLGQLFVEAYPSSKRAEKLWADKFRLRYLEAKKLEGAAEQIDLAFELGREGAAPRLHNVSRASAFCDQRTAVAKTASLIRDALTRIAEIDGTPSDLLILVPFATTKERFTDWRQIALNACCQLGIESIDYTVTESRRLGYSPNEVRLATYHSSRGIEAWHSVVLGFECLSAAAKEQDDFAANLGYIALTRSLFETDIVFCHPPGMINVDIAFLEKAMQTTGF